MKILIAGDFVITHSYSASKINKNVISLFADSDINIINLEAPITESNSKILKTGPNLKVDKQSTLEALKALKVNVVTLANNHILDYGEQGVKDTLDLCEKNNIRTVGAGLNLEQASTTLHFEGKDIKIAVVNFAENEWSAAEESSAGFNPMDIIDNAEQIKAAKDIADHVIVIVHGGHEYYNLPSPRIRKQYRFYAEQGADIVVGHHSHCVSGNEIHNGIPIYYSLGNFIFTSPSNYEDWYEGLILEINICDGKINCNLHPIEQKKNSYELSLLSGKEKETVFRKISYYSSTITNDFKIMANWDDYVAMQSKEYLNYLSPLSFIKNRYVSGFLRKLNINFSGIKGSALLLNMLRCEAHRNLSIDVIKNFLRTRNY
ncbi:CapA family protein [Kaistella palustris]|uniref:CapA family protein n=1 Tax=Kaistella palustris TaxID=493376 RepID=UPI000403A8F2|nr:CapA family protein [Kaistella palustris]